MLILSWLTRQWRAIWDMGRKGTSSDRIKNANIMTEASLRNQWMGKSEAFKKSLLLERSRLESEALKNPTVQNMIQSVDFAMEGLEDKDATVRLFATFVLPIFHADTPIRMLVPKYKKMALPVNASFDP